MNQQERPAITRALKTILPITLFTVFGMAAGFWFGKFLKGMPNLVAQADVLNAWDLVLLPVWYVLVIGIHEMGHLAGGMRRGMRFLLLIVGPFQLSQSVSGVRFSWAFNLGTFGGLAAAMPNPDRPLRPQMLSLVAGGPLASLILAWLAVCIFFFSDGRVAAHAVVIGLMSGMIFLVTAIPSRAGGFMSDGKQFIELMRDGETVMARQRMTSLMAQSLSGIRPRDWNADWLQAECQNASGDSVQIVATRQMAFIQALDSGDAAQTDEHAQWLAEHYADYPLGFRQSLCIELGLFALSNGDVDKAKHWHSQSKGGVVDKSRRALFDAELAGVQGDTELAKKHALLAQKYLHKGMDAGLSRLTEERLDALLIKLAASKAL